MRRQKFNNVVDQQRGYGMDLFYFQKKYESTNLYEDEDELDTHNRETLKNYGPDRIGFAYEEPRRNTGGRERLNLQHAGVYSSETSMPWRNDDFDMNFTDKDQRGHLEEHNWQLFRQNNEQRFKLQPFKNDQDWSIPSNGVHPTKMSEQLVELRRQLKGRLNWFDESLDNFAGGRTTNSYNNPHGREELEELDLGVSDANSRNPVNRVMSNYMNTGGTYFKNYTTTDHIIPTASYGFLFKSHAPETPRQATNIMSKGSQKFGNSRECNKIKQILSKSEAGFAGYEDRKFNKLLESVNKSSKIDILNILFTENEIKYLNSKECANRSDVQEMRKNIIELIKLVDKLPPNARLNITNDLLRKITPSYKGGGSGEINLKIKNILETRNLRTFKGQDNLDLSIESGKKNNIIRENLNVRTEGKINNVDNSIETGKKNNITREGENFKVRNLKIGKLISENDEIEDYSKLLVNNKGYCENKFEGQRYETEDVLVEEIEDKLKSFVKPQGGPVETENDFIKGEERVWESELKSWSNCNENYLEKKIKREN